MKNKHLIIMFIVSLGILIITSLLLSKGGFVPGVLKENAITSIGYWIIILVLFLASIIVSLESVFLYIIGIIFKHTNNKRKRSK